jgi:retron-type reverse transcriptase
LKAKVLVPQLEERIHPDSGVPQSEILSPLLFNIYLHELDKYMAAYIKEFNVGTALPHSSEYRRVFILKMDPRPKFTYIHDTQAVTNEKVNKIF